MSRNLVSQWRRRSKMPEPDAHLAACGPVWLEATIKPWIKEQKRARR